MTTSSSRDLYIDGSWNPASGTGGWAFVVLDDGRQLHAESGSESTLSNNSAEVLAAVKAMYWIETYGAGKAVTLWTDSNHVVEGCLRYRAIWRNNGWKRIDPNPRARRRPLADAALWKQFDALLENNPLVTVELCKGHSGNAGNELADSLARDAARSEPAKAKVEGAQRAALPDDIADDTKQRLGAKG